MFTDPSKSVGNITMLADDHCQLRVFMVGGGGHAVNSNIGGGSGYIKYSSIILTESNIIQTLQVGDYGQPSTVTIQDGVFLEASPGQNGISGGWSGGGGPNCNCDGGSDGGDGSGAGGKGTGEKLSSFPMESFILTPGLGGQAYGNSGGGGGGVLVNGAGPEEWDPTQGQGYGGGGCDYDSQGNDESNQGLRGVILLEMVP